jgi:hypothetical protein
MVLAALAVDGLFSVLHLIPEVRPPRADIFSSVKVDYKLFLNVLGVAIFAVLFGLTLRRGAAGAEHGCEMHGGGHHEHSVSGAH